MSEKDLTQPASGHSTPKPSVEERRKTRLDAALRANLHRRKEQVRSRGLGADSGERDTPSIFKAGGGRTNRK